MQPFTNGIFILSLALFLGVFNFRLQRKQKDLLKRRDLLLVLKLIMLELQFREWKKLFRSMRKCHELQECR